jgi:PleD family two-component response regulator
LALSTLTSTTSDIGIHYERIHSKTAVMQMKILAVDDEPFILEMIPLVAERVGFPHVEIASSGAMALRILEEADPVFDCLILDINMPEIDGIELCRIVRQMDSYRQTPIIILTAMSDRRFVDQAFQAGATDYATKPFDLTELGARLRLANELVTARRDAAALRANTTTTPGTSWTLQDVDGIVGVPKLADMVSLKNYLKRLSRAGVTSSQVVAFGIDRIEGVQSIATTEELHYALREVASAIGTILEPTTALMAYAGNGIFLAASNSAVQLDPEQIEGDVQYFLDDRNLQYDNGVPMNFEVYMGGAVRPISASSDEIEKCIQRAVARLEARVQAQQNRRISPSIR